MTLSIFRQFPVPTYARGGEDMLAAQYFPMPYQGFYIDAGCYKPIEYSNTYLLYTMGWRGLCIDANPVYAAEYAEKRPGDVFVNCGLAATAGEMTFYDVAEDPSSSTFHKPQVDVLREKVNATITERRVQVRRLMDVINEQKIDAIDLLNIDVEFYDEEILRTFDFAEFRPRVILIEDLTFNMARPQDSGIYRFLSDLGYLLEGRCVHTCMYIMPVTTIEQTHLARARQPV